MAAAGGPACRCGEPLVRQAAGEARGHRGQQRPSEWWKGRMTTLPEQLEAISNRLERIEASLALLVQQRTAKDWYATDEVAEILGNKSAYTVREWCRKGQVPAEKTANGRDWIVSHQTLLRLKNRELPLPEHQAHGVFNGRGK